MRVIAGEARGRRLEALPGTDITRPTLDQVKEAMFSIVQFDLPGARVLDLYAGSGQLGIEALSREQFDLVLLDPPFHNGTLENILPIVDKCVAPGGIVICESETKLVLPAEVGGLQLKKQYKYGKVLLWKYVRPMADAAEEEGEA